MACGELSSEFAISNCVRQGYPLSPFLSKSVVDLLLEITLSSSEFPEIDSLLGDSLVDLIYTYDIVLFGGNANKILSILLSLSNNAILFGMHFYPSL